MYRMFFLPLTLAISCQIALASTTNEPLDGNELVAYYTGRSALPAADEETGKALAQLYASGYLNGVIDAGQNTHWCFPEKLLRGEALSKLIHQLAALPELKRKQNGAALVTELLTSMHTCT